MNRVGLGYDIHAFAEGRPLVLGGVAIDYPLGLAGHSDADVLSHAIADAVLGALGERDIGFHFPNDDPSIEGISSLDILAKAKGLAASQHAEIVNVDSTLVAQEPKIGPYLEEMKGNISHSLGITPRQVGIKATTNEGLGALGRMEGIAALAVVSIELRP